MTASPHQTRGTTHVMRGVQRIWDPRVRGTIVGAIGATVFVMANRVELPGAWPTVAVVVWAVALAAYLWRVFINPRTFGPMAAVGRRASLTSLASVLGMLVMIRLGSAYLESVERPGLQPAVIVVAVGLHFLPFAAAFHTPMFTRLGTLMALIGTTGLLLGWLADPRWAPAAAVLTGIVMLVVIALDAVARVRPDPSTSRRSAPTASELPRSSSARHTAGKRCCNEWLDRLVRDRWNQPASTAVGCELRRGHLHSRSGTWQRGRVGHGCRLRDLDDRRLHSCAQPSSTTGDRSARSQRARHAHSRALRSLALHLPRCWA